MDQAQFVVHWLHVLMAIFWFGSVLTLDFLLIPALNTLPIDRQRQTGAAYGAIAGRIIPFVGALTIVLGILRGTVFGTIKDLDTLIGEAYGQTWLVALVAAILTFIWGGWVLGKAVERMDAIPASEAIGPDGSATPVLVTAIARVRRLAMLELVGFAVIFTAMILMRFGL